MKQPIIGQKVNNEAIDALIDSLSAIVDEDAVFYVGYPVAATIDSPVTVPALLISVKFGLICFDVVPLAKASDLTNIRAKQRSIVLALKAKLLQHPDLAGDDDLLFKVNVITFALAFENVASLIDARIVDSAHLNRALESCFYPARAHCRHGGDDRPATRADLLRSRLRHRWIPARDY